MRFSSVVVAGSAASSSTTAASAATTSTTAAAAAAARETGEPSPSLIRVRPEDKVVTGFRAAPAADIPREGVAGSGAAGAAGGANLR